jgi:hypothetical protein
VSGGGGARRAGAVSRARVNIPWSGLVGMSGTKVDVSERLRICRWERGAYLEDWWGVWGKEHGCMVADHFPDCLPILTRKQTDQFL